MYGPYKSAHKNARVTLTLDFKALGGMPTFDLFASDGLLKYDAWGTVSSAENFVKLYRQLPNGVKLSYC